jgi:hypothetical protein
MKLDSQHLAERVFRGKQHGARHPGSDIDEAELVYGRDWGQTPPANDHRTKDGRGDSVVGSRVPVVPMPGGEVPSGYQAAGADAEFQIEWMADQAVLNGQPRQRQPTLLPLLAGGLLGLRYLAGVHA